VERVFLFPPIYFHVFEVVMLYFNLKYTLLKGTNLHTFYVDESSFSKYEDRLCCGSSSRKNVKYSSMVIN
jgi:hypothetical protein